jgi:uncharacterized protein involved in exopolysaccharide biosynthesis
LQEKHEFLEGISIDSGLVSTVTVDEPARVPYRAERPRKTVIILIALVLGSVVAITAAFISESIFRVRQEREARLR